MHTALSTHFIWFPCSSCIGMFTTPEVPPSSSFYDVIITSTLSLWRMWRLYFKHSINIRPVYVQCSYLPVWQPVKMFLSIWPFYTPPPKENIAIFSSLPAWATVGLDMTPDEFASILFTRASEGKTLILSVVDVVYTYLPVVLLAAMVISLCIVYKRKMERRSEVSLQRLIILG